MSRIRLAALAAVCLASTSVAAEGKVKISVVPYAPLYDSIPRATGERIAETLVTELQNNEAFEVAPLPDEGGGAAAAAPEAKKGPSDAASKAIEAAKADLEKGKDLLGKRKVKPALDAFDRTIAAYEKHADAVFDVQPLVQANLKRAVALFLLGREDEAAKGPIPAAVRLDPSITLTAGEEYANVFVGEVEKARKRLAAEGYGALRIDTTPPGAQVKVDDRDATTTPVLVKGLLPGVHYVQIKPPGGDWYAQKIEVKRDDTAKITPDTQTKKEGAIAATVTYLSKNNLDDGAKKQIDAIAAKTGAAFVVIGGAYAKGPNMGIVSLLYSKAKGGFVDLPALELDRDMLGAAIEINKISGEIALATDAFGSPAKLPRPLAADAKAGAEKINEVDFAVAAVATKDGGGGGAVGAPAGAGNVGVRSDGGARKPVSGRRPIVGGKPEDGMGPEAAATPVEKPAPVALGGAPVVKPKLEVDENGMVVSKKDDFAAPPTKAAVDAEKARKYMVGGGSIEDEKAFEEEDDGLLSSPIFWVATVGGVLLVGGAVVLGTTLVGDSAPSQATATITW